MTFCHYGRSQQRYDEALAKICKGRFARALRKAFSILFK
jgi:hypothetical protein